MLSVFVQTFWQSGEAGRKLRFYASAASVQRCSAVRTRTCSRSYHRYLDNCKRNRHGISLHVLFDDRRYQGSPRY